MCLLHLITPNLTVTKPKRATRVMKRKQSKPKIICMFILLTTPAGTAVGIAITNAYDENSPTALIVEGLLNAASSGILIYMALVDLPAADFMNPKLQNNGILQVGASVSLPLGLVLVSLGYLGLKKVSKKNEVPIKGLDYIKAWN
ncbi:hypothetical protein GOBAR_AA29851 [Gossypium barbadense]|uniref:Uncharacterized protein n=1 Tax=Gossypium barbadense TaxID=3634 RepID=A0A2P5WID3_GOSBA|nr:hypothetical protein GOBAR_AA29851 [Gossypium barbadense]